MKNHDNDTFHKRPTAWRKVKEAIGDHWELAMIFRRLERIAGEGSVRLHFTFALHAYNAMTDAQRERAQAAYWEWAAMLEGKGEHSSPPRPAPAAEMLPPGERVQPGETPGHKLCEDWGTHSMWQAPDAERSVSYGPFYFLCGKCGKKYLDSSALHRHLLNLHGIDVHAARQQQPAERDDQDDDTDGEREAAA